MTPLQKGRQTPALHPAQEPFSSSTDLNRESGFGCSEDWSKIETPPQWNTTQALSAATARQAHLTLSTRSTSFREHWVKQPLRQQFPEMYWPVC